MNADAQGATPSEGPPFTEGTAAEQQFAQRMGELGPFSPPDDYEFEPELQGESPRPIPDELLYSPFVQKKRNAAWGCLFAGALCFVGSYLPIVDYAALFLLPLAYIGWIGLGLVVIGIGLWIRRHAVTGPLRFVRDGVPEIVRVVDIAYGPSVIINGIENEYAFQLMIENLQLGAIEPTYRSIQSPGVPVSAKDKATTSMQPGDYITAVKLPKHPSLFTLYDLTNLHPERGVIIPGRTAVTGLLEVLGVIGVVFGFLGGLMTLFYVFDKYSPVDLTFAQGFWPFAIGGVAAYALLGVAIWHETRKALPIEATEVEPNEEPRVPMGFVEGFRSLFSLAEGCIAGIAVLVGIFGLGGLAGLSVAFCANAWLDESQPTYRPLRIDQLVMTTHNWVVRTYSIEYTYLDTRTESSVSSTPYEIILLETDYCRAEIREGWLGWPWQKAIHSVPIHELQEFLAPFENERRLNPPPQPAGDPEPSDPIVPDVPIRSVG